MSPTKLSQAYHTRQSYCTAVPALPSELNLAASYSGKKKIRVHILDTLLCSRRSSQLQLRPATEPRDLPTLRRRFPGKRQHLLRAIETLSAQTSTIQVSRNQRRPETTKNRSQSWGWECSTTRSWTTSLVRYSLSRARVVRLVSQRRGDGKKNLCVLLARQLTAHSIHRHHTILRRPREAPIRDRWHTRAEMRHERSCSHHSGASTVRRPQ